jgi:hypothetical protein
MNNSVQKKNIKWWQVAVSIPFVPLVLALLLTALPLYLVATVCLHAIIWVWWCLRGRDILFVYSDSPVWHDYIEERMLPYLGKRAVVLNWSQRKRWHISLARIAFSHFGGYRHFNPLAVVFRPFRRTRTFRFWSPFREFKHGHPEALHRMESEFLGLIGVRHNPSA